MIEGLDWRRPELWPWLLALPILWFGLWLLFRHARRGMRAWGARCVERARLPGVRATTWTAIGACLLLTWIEPLYGEETVQIERRGIDLVVCLDVSRSMLARDVEPSRLERAKRDVHTVLPELIGGDRIGLIAFAGEARLVVPLTHDLESFGYLLEQVDTDTIRVGGSDLAEAIRQGLGLINDEQQSTSAILVLTDGEDLEGAGRQAAREAKDQGVIVHAVGYGSIRGSKIVLEEDGEASFLANAAGDEVVSAMDVDGLRSMAEAAQGAFVRADVVPLPLRDLKRKRIDPMAKRSFDAGEEVLPQTRYQWVLLPGLLLVLLELLWSRGRRG